MWRVLQKSYIFAAWDPGTIHGPENPESRALKATTRTQPTQLSRGSSAAIYCRISSKTNEDKDGARRQTHAAKSAAKNAGMSPTAIEKMKNICDVVSGSLPLEQRRTLQNLLKENKIKTIYVESLRALSRDAAVGENIVQECQKQNKTIVTADLPGLCAAGPVKKFVRSVMFGVMELEKELLVGRMKDWFLQELPLSLSTYIYIYMCDILHMYIYTDVT